MLDSWGYSSVGRAPALQAGGQEFESPYLHLIIQEQLCLKRKSGDANLFARDGISFQERIFAEYP